MQLTRIYLCKSIPNSDTVSLISTIHQYSYKQTTQKKIGGRRMEVQVEKKCQKSALNINP